MRAEINRRRLLKSGIATATGILLSAAGSRQGWSAYPERPVRIIVPQPPAGPTDIAARFIAAELSQVLGNAVFIENKPGAGGNIGIGFAARTEPDGYTLLVASSTFTVNPAMYSKIPYEPLRDFIPVCEMAVAPNCVVVDPKLGISSMKELVESVRKEPGKFNYTSPGAGTNPHLAAEMLKASEKIDMVHVPHTGGGPALQAILSGTVPILFSGLPPAHPYITSGTLKALALLGPNRWHDLPEVPTWNEIGYLGPSFETFQAIFAPAATPTDIIARIEAETLRILRRAEFKQKLLQAGFEVTALSGASLKAKISEELLLWRDVVTKAGISPR